MRKMSWCEGIHVINWEWIPETKWETVRATGIHTIHIIQTYFFFFLTLKFKSYPGSPTQGSRAWSQQVLGLLGKMADCSGSKCKSYPGSPTWGSWAWSQQVLCLLGKMADCSRSNIAWQLDQACRYSHLIEIGNYLLLSLQMVKQKNNLAEWWVKSDMTYFYPLLLQELFMLVLLINFKYISSKTLWF